MSKVLNIELSKELVKKIKPPTRNCFERAYQGTLLTPNSHYVQGFLVLAHSPYVPIEYSWLEVDNEIVDPNPKHLKDTETQPDYFSAQSLSEKQLKAAVEEAVEDYPDDEPLPVYGHMPYEYYGEVMLGGKAYQNAYEEALAKCRELKRKTLKLSSDKSKQVEPY
jgi:hypothetical protein